MQGAFHIRTNVSEMNCSLAKQFEDAESYAQYLIYYDH